MSRPTSPAPITRSPPLAFEATPNDSLLPPPASDTSASPSNMGRRSPLLSPPAGHERDLRLLVDQQANALHLLHEAFAAERRAWAFERDGLNQRILSLEQLLKTGDHWSPAKSPVISPSPGGDILSPTSRAVAANPTLPTITEDENIQPLSARRPGAPQSILLHSTGEDDGQSRRQSTVSFTNEEGMVVEEIPAPPVRGTNLSPPPANNRMLAGHTPVRVPRPPTPPPQKMSFDGIEDTPTRNNTHINMLVTQSRDEEADPELRGPLNMPELPNRPDETNFTLEMLSRKLESIERYPDIAKPQVFAQPSPGLASPANEEESRNLSPDSKAHKANSAEVPLAPFATRTSDMPQSEASSNARSPSALAMSPQEVHEAKVHQDFEQGGIRLKKKASINFGAPLGLIGGFGGGGVPPRRTSQDPS